MEYKSLEFKDFNSLDKKDKGTFEGVLVGFDNVDHGNDVIDPKAVNRTLKEWRRKNQFPPVLWNHDDDQPVGEHLEMRPEADGLYVKGKIWIDKEGVPPTEAAIKAYNVSTSNGPKSMSVGFITQKATKSSTGTRILQDIDILEGSILSYGMNDKAIILSAKSLFASEDGTPIDIRTMEKILRDGGLSQRMAKAFLAEGYRGLQRDARELVNDEDAIKYLAASADELLGRMVAHKLQSNTFVSN